MISEETQDVRWAEYFREILNRPPPETEPDNPVVVEDLEIQTSPPSKEEIINAIKALKTINPLDATTSIQSFSKQTQLLPQKFFSPS